jgi:hypothetical protein
LNAQKTKRKFLKLESAPDFEIAFHHYLKPNLDLKNPFPLFYVEQAKIFFYERGIDDVF